MSVYVHVFFITIVKSFVEFVKYLFTLQEVQEHRLAFLSNHICQDPLECFFGCQRQRGDNPSVSEFYNNTQAQTNSVGDPLKETVELLL